jgi:hypothetical protein
MRKHATNFYKAIVLLLVAVVFMNCASRVICHEADGRIGIESAHAPGMCEGAAQGPDQAATLEDGKVACSDTPLGDDGLQTFRRVGADLPVLHFAAVVAFQLPLRAAPVRSCDLRRSSSSQPSILRTTILLV